MSEKEYIEREAVLDELLYAMSGTGFQSRAMDAVHFVPAANVVEVVRCKDCKWWHTDGCAFRKDAVKDLPAADDFCSHGERK